MNYATAALCAVFCITLLGSCTALPLPTIQTQANDQTRAVIFGVLVLASIGAVLGACLCCRTRKRGFKLNHVKDRKEFENESGAVEGARTTEFPIFRALAGPPASGNNNQEPPETGSAAVIVPAHNNAVDDEPEFDNNNGPISPADMENIENNNAIDYIPNRNEIAAAAAAAQIMPEPHSPLRSEHLVNRNSADTSTTAAVASVPMTPSRISATAFQTVLDIDTDTLQGRSSAAVSSLSPGQSSTYSRSDSLNETNPFIEYSVGTPVDVVDVHIDMDGSAESTEEPLLGFALSDRPAQRQAVPFTYAVSEPMRFTDPPYTEQTTAVVRSSIVVTTPNVIASTEPTIEMPSVVKTNAPNSPNEYVTGCDVAVAPGSCNDFSSVEEALRVLDFAISGGDSLLQRDDSAEDDDDDDDDGGHDDEIVENKDRVHEVTECERLNDGVAIVVRNLLADTHASSSDNVDDKETIAHARHLAEELVAGIMAECQAFTNHKLQSQKEFNNSPDNDHNRAFLKENNEDSQEHQEDDHEPSIMFMQDSSLNATVVDAGHTQIYLENSPNTSEIHPVTDWDNSGELSESVDFEQSPMFVASTPLRPCKPVDRRCPQIFPVAYDPLLPDVPAIHANATYNADSLMENAMALIEEADCDERPTESNTKLSAIILAPLMPTIKIISDTSDTTSEDLTTATPVNTPIELNYNMDTWDKFVLKNMSQPIQSTVAKKPFDVQEPCTSAQAAAREQEAATAAAAAANVTFDASPTSDAANNSGWFLHPQSETGADGTFNVNDNEDSEYGNTDETEDNEENLNITFDALRKQLAEALPHAQGSMAGPQEFSDDDDDDDGAGDANEEGVACADGSYEDPRISLPPTEMVINYKRPLSPIMEESEDETCKTFVLNETKCLDSTSTGCLETGEAIMGVTKTLMASNDTLFNFEDTLGDRDDMFSPRTPSALSQIDHLQSSRSSSSSIYECRTPTGTASTPAASSVFSAEELVNRCIGDHDDGDERVRSASVPNDDTVNDSFTFSCAGVAAVDLLSPDQPKTFSEDICSAELSAAADATFTNTTTTLEEKTCISVPLPPKDDRRLSQVSEPEWGSSMLLDMSLEDIPSLNAFDDLDEDSQDQQDTITTGGEQAASPGPLATPNASKPFALTDVDTRQLSSDLEFLTSVKNFGYQTNELYQAHRSDATDEKENANPNENTTMDDEPPSTKECNGDRGVAVESIFFDEPDLIRDCSEQAFADIRFSGPSTELMSTSFSAPSTEWDSDVDESNSSEEFMFVKGPPVLQTTSATELRAIVPTKQQLPGITEDASTADIDSVWNTHHDKVPVSSSSANDDNDDRQHNGGTTSGEEEYDGNDGDDDADDDGDDDEDDDGGNSHNSSSDAEGEWVPSCWDSMAQPARSALKSPDKSSSGTTKKRRNVAFKKQHYHSVYEYPKEVSLSPAYSAPHMSWTREFGGQLHLFDGSLTSSAAGAAADLAGLDGFTVSSSSRPFHSSGTGGSQFNAQNHTWPTSDSDFSWSQVQEDNETDGANHFPTYSELQIKWPKELGDCFYSEEASDPATSADITRPDSGVGESAELLSESISLGDLCHTKASLRLPLNFLPTVVASADVTSEIGRLDSDKSVLPIDDEDAMSSSSSAAAVANDENAANEGDDDDDGNDDDDDDDDVERNELPIQNNRNHSDHLINAILPTPSCTGSMDSLSSSSGSERQLSFTTFGKTTNNHHQQQQQVDDRNRLNECGDTVLLKPALVLIEDNMQRIDDQTTGLTNAINAIATVGLTTVGTKKPTSTKQNDSTDEDSGIESIMRISKERSVNY